MPYHDNMTVTDLFLKPFKLALKTLDLILVPRALSRDSLAQAFPFLMRARAYASKIVQETQEFASCDFTSQGKLSQYLFIIRDSFT